MKKLSKLFLMLSLMSAIHISTLKEIVLADSTKGQITVNGRIGESSDGGGIKDPGDVKDPEEDDKYGVTDDSDNEPEELPNTGSENRDMPALIGTGILLIVAIVFIKKNMKSRTDRPSKR